MLPMPSSDRVILRNIVIVVLASTGAATLLGMSCLNRGDVRQEPGTTSIRSSAGGISPGVAGTTSVTSSDMPPPGQPGPITNRPLPTPARQPTAAPTNVRPTEIAPPASASANASARNNQPPPPMYDQNGVPYGLKPVNSTNMPYMLPDGSVPNVVPGTLPPNMPPGLMPQNVPGNGMPQPQPSATPPPQGAQNQPPQGAQNQPPPRFATEAPPWAASNYPSNPEAGAGQFITDTPQAR